MKRLLKFSIITVSLHDKNLNRTLKSVISQNISSKYIEHIIVEGDPTLKYNPSIQKYIKTSKYKVTYICEKDKGIYNAMNKGIQKSTGKYLMFLNAGDTLSSKGTLQKVYKTHFSQDILYGDSHYKNESQPRRLQRFNINKSFFIRHNLFHQSTFINRKLFTAVGMYNEKYRIVSDFDFWLRVVNQSKATFKYLPFVISNYDTKGISSTNINQLYLERSSAIMHNFSGYQHYFHLLKYIYYRIRMVIYEHRL